MKNENYFKLMVLLLVLVTSFTSAFSQEKSKSIRQTFASNVDTAIQVELQAAVDAMTMALKNKDKKMFDNYVAPDYIHTNPAGEVTSREKEFSDMTSGVQTFSIELVPLEYDKVRVYNGNTAVIPSHYKVTGNDHEQSISMQTRALATWVKTNGKWQLVAFQATGVAKPFYK